LFDYRLISLYDGDYARSHFAHEQAELEVTIKREPEEEVEYSAFVRAVDETWDEAREYASSSQIRLAQKLKRERDEYL
jgi:ribosome-binding protein aMBF1 (putative translation factor)